MLKTINVLIFPAGEMNSAELCFALSRQVNIKLFGASSFERMGRHLFKNYRNDLPVISHERFLDSFTELLREWAIDIVIPTHDSVVKFFSDHRDKFECKLLIPSARTARACRDKEFAMNLFQGDDFVPQIYLSPDHLPKDVFVKPKEGQGAVGARKMSSQSPAIYDIDWHKELVSEYLPGEEITVDCFTDGHQRLLGVFPRSRDRLLGGICVAGVSMQATDEINQIARRINDELDFLGMWFFQLKRASNNRWKLLEISARCSGTQCLTRARGVNLPLLSVYAAMGREVSVTENNIGLRMDRLLVPMFDFDYKYEAAYVDYDDTLVHTDGVDPEIIGLLYQWRRDGIRIVLITRHAGDLREHMNRHSIVESLFDEIIHIDDESLKSDHINPENAVFVDNSHVERQQVRLKFGIPVFDVEGAQVLKRWTL